MVQRFYLQTNYFWSGAEGIRTPDLRRAKAALSQLSYGPDVGWDGEFTAVAQGGLTEGYVPDHTLFDGAAGLRP